MLQNGWPPLSNFTFSLITVLIPLSIVSTRLLHSPCVKLSETFYIQCINSAWDLGKKDQHFSIFLDVWQDACSAEKCNFFLHFEVWEWMAKPALLNFSHFSFALTEPSIKTLSWHNIPLGHNWRTKFGFPLLNKPDGTS